MTVSIPDSYKITLADFIRNDASTIDVTYSHGGAESTLSLPVSSTVTSASGGATYATDISVMINDSPGSTIPQGAEITEASALTSEGDVIISRTYTSPLAVETEAFKIILSVRF